MIVDDGVQKYKYDTSCNILKKTTNGKTTTYTYDDANQLISSVAPDGKEIYYTYDAAGRLVKEGEKTYEYGWLDKGELPKTARNLRALNITTTDNLQKL